ncbi:MAG: uracil-DNA glycosylase [Gemmatimonadota bacterium]
MSGEDPRELLRAYLRQRAELGETELVLEGLGADELRALYARRPERPAIPGRPEPAQRPGPAAPPQAAAASPAGALESPMRPSPDAPAAYAPAEEILRLPVLDAVREVALGCPRCRLAETRSHVVFGEGNPDADVIVVGEAPGADEDRTGRPFVGKAGKLLTLLLASVGLEREQVYICNVLKCRPPGNRNPMPDEVEACSPYLLRQVELVKPRAIAAFGAFAAQTLLQSTTPIGQLRRRVHDFRGIPLVATYHPAALLRSSAWVRPTWEDLQRLRSVLDGRGNG